MPDVHRFADRLGRQDGQANGFGQIADVNQGERRILPRGAGQHASLGHLEERQEAEIGAPEIKPRAALQSTWK